MKLEYVPVKGQKFDIGRTINPANCDCKVCTFMNCPKKNYAVKMTRKKYAVDDFWNEYKDDILKINHPKRWQHSFRNNYEFKLTYNLIDRLLDVVFPNFPKGMFWSPNDPANTRTEVEETVYREILFVKISRSGKEILLGGIGIGLHTIFDYDLNERQYRFAEKVCESIRWLKEKVFEYYHEKHLDKNVGWLSPEGRHYPCDHCEHITLARAIGGSEISLEMDGWVKIISGHEDGFFLNSRTGTAEQRNWLSEHGYILED